MGALHLLSAIGAATDSLVQSYQVLATLVVGYVSDGHAWLDSALGTVTSAVASHNTAVASATSTALAQAKVSAVETFDSAWTSYTAARWQAFASFAQIKAELQVTGPAHLAALASAGV